MPGGSPSAGVTAPPSSAGHAVPRTVMPVTRPPGAVRQTGPPSARTRRARLVEGHDGAEGPRVEVHRRDVVEVDRPGLGAAEGSRAGAGRGEVGHLEERHVGAVAVAVEEAPRRGPVLDRRDDLDERVAQRHDRVAQAEQRHPRIRVRLPERERRAQLGHRRLELAGRDDDLPEAHHGPARYLVARATMRVEIWSDIACPWCYIGKRRLETALAAFEHRDEVEVVWRAFELDPAAPPERGDLATHLAQKYGLDRDRALQLQQRVTDVAAEEGLEFRFDRARAGNTFDAHRLVRLAAAHGRQDAMEERLMRAYLTEGELLSDHETLIRLAEEVGLDPEAARAMLASGDLADEVREDERTAAAFEIRAVPFFVADRTYGASGAQPPDMLLAMLQQA